MTERRHPLLLRPGVPVRLDHQQVGAHGVTGKLGTIKRSDGATQATYDGHRLYT